MKLQLWLAGICLFLVLIAFPAPSSVGVAEVLMALTSLGFLAHFLIIQRKKADLSSASKVVGFTLVAHVLGWIIASVIGMIQGVDALTLARSLLPQILFAPLAFIGFSFFNHDDSKRLVRPLIWVAFFHALYLIGLGVFAYSNSDNLAISRITFLDPRTTVPLFLALVPFGLAMITKPKMKTKLGGLTLCFMGAASALATQTRAQLLAIFVAGLVFGYLYLLAHPTKTTIAVAVSLVLVGVASIFIVPPLRNLALSVIERQAKVGDNARFEAEWRPALESWDNHGTPALVTGIGLGVPIRILTGEENTYVHNQLIYTVVYTGLLGTILIFSVYFSAFIVLVKRFLKEKIPEDAAAAALLVCLFSYGLFFAVHKLFSYNLMVFVIIALAMRGSKRFNPVSEPEAQKLPNFLTSS